jgi:hypothetical protein
MVGGGWCYYQLNVPAEVSVQRAVEESKSENDHGGGEGNAMHCHLRFSGSVGGRKSRD